MFVFIRVRESVTCWYSAINHYTACIHFRVRSLIQKSDRTQMPHGTIDFDCKFAGKFCRKGMNTL